MDYDLERSPLRHTVDNINMTGSLNNNCARLVNFSISSEEEGEMKNMSSSDVVTSTGNSVASVTYEKTLSADELDSNEVLRRHIACEILETERKYCACLRTAVVHFAESIQHSKIICDGDLKTMFPQSLRVIYNYHVQFLQDLECRLGGTNRQNSLGDVFLAFINSLNGDLFAQYQFYVGQFSEAQLLIRRMSRRNMSFKKLILKLEGDACCEGLGVDAYLHTPVQRMPRYVLLLKQLLRNTSANHLDHSNIKVCHDRMSEFLIRLNETLEKSLVSSSGDHSECREKHVKRARFSFGQLTHGRSDRNLKESRTSRRRKWPGKENSINSRTVSSPALIQQTHNNSTIGDNSFFTFASFRNSSSSKPTSNKHIGVPENHSTPFRTNLVLRQGKLLGNGRGDVGRYERKRKYPLSPIYSTSSMSLDCASDAHRRINESQIDDATIFKYPVSQFVNNSSNDSKLPFSLATFANTSHSRLDSPFIFGKSGTTENSKDCHKFCRTSDNKHLVSNWARNVFPTANVNGIVTSNNSVTTMAIDCSLSAFTEIRTNCNSNTIISSMDTSYRQNTLESTVDFCRMTGGVNVAVPVRSNIGTCTNQGSPMASYKGNNRSGARTTSREYVFTDNTTRGEDTSLINDTNMVNLSVVNTAYPTQLMSSVESQEGKVGMDFSNADFLKMSVKISSSMSTKFVERNGGIFRRHSKKTSHQSMMDESGRDVSVGGVSTGIKRKTSLKDSFCRLFVRKRIGKANDEDSINEEPRIDGAN